ncbi:MAG: hypothetical protein MJZ73_05785 [Bacteroidaceae bacterium]|nr:hypothetical protein [Bacteroidaceae bacterium]
MKKGLLVGGGVLLAISAAVWWFLQKGARELEDMLVEQGITMLEERLHTKVSADSVSVNIKKGDLAFYGVQINDQKDSVLLHIDTLTAGLSTRELLNKQVLVRRVNLHGGYARIYKTAMDSTANIQFLVDALKKKPKPVNPDKKKTFMEFDVRQIDVRNLQFKYDVLNLARKNEGKPNFGAFDANHVDAFINLDANLHSLGKDSLVSTINHLMVNDISSGLRVNNLTTTVGFSKEWISTQDVSLSMDSTQIQLSPVTARLVKLAPDPVTGKKMTGVELQPVTVTADIWLTDIAEPFAPPLSHFYTPLHLEAVMAGNQDRFTFSDIRINSLDNRFTLTAQGDLCDLLKKHDLSLHFTDIEMNATDGIKEEMVNHFAQKVNLKMQRQMHQVGDVKFKGTMGIFYKLERFDGTLYTKYGNVKTQFDLDGNTKFMNGTLSSDRLEVGKFMNIDDLESVEGTARFSFDIANKNMSQLRTVKNGKLPHGTLDAELRNIQYKFIHFNEARVSMTSNGSVAHGEAIVPQGLFDLVTGFSYTQTRDVQHLEVHPSVKRSSRSRSTLRDADKKPKRKFSDIFKIRKKKDKE